MWGFDGSSTQQADGSDSIVAYPAVIYPDSARHNGFLIMNDYVALTLIHPTQEQLLQMTYVLGWIRARIFPLPRW